MADTLDDAMATAINTNDDASRALRDLTRRASTLLDDQRMTRAWLESAARLLGEALPQVDAETQMAISEEVARWPAVEQAAFHATADDATGRAA